MLVKHNLLLNGGRLQIPEYVYDKTMANISLKDNRVYVTDLRTSMAGFTIDKLRESTLALNNDKTYYIGFFGRVEGNIDIYKGQYKPYQTKGDFNYIELKGSEITGPMHIRSSSGANVTLESICLFEGEIGDIFVSSKGDLPKDKRPLLPPEGDYKEIQPR
ncbi:hypothetical protein [Anaerococcus marasmi]|uniref:hypothetical protein n=1 Tax=Anaerococcus marasmi TaxID=2057797 RepID=UPI000CF93B8D|nr:hypothetical protein [Anaerococcus marasmi]